MLFGEISAFGKLPVTFYETLEEIPEFTDYSMKGRTYRYMEHKAQYPFGFGLNYGKTVLKEAFYKDGKVKATVENQGEFDTDEVVQIYIKSEDSVYAVPNPQLCAFKRISVKAKEIVTTELTLDSRAFTVVDDRGERLVPGGNYTLYVGFGQADARTEELTGTKSVRISVNI